MIQYVKRYKPNVVENNDTMDSLYTVQGDEVEKVNLTINSIIDNLFIKTSNLEGVKRWEKFYNIKSNSLRTLEERRAIVLNKLLYRPPFTRQRLNEILSNIWGEGNYIYQLYPDDYRLIIDINTNNPVIYLQFSNLLRDIIPANIYLVLSIQYTYIYLGRNYTYGKLHDDGLTYEELSRYANVDPAQTLSD